MTEAPLQDDGHGQKPTGPGWFIANLATCAWKSNDRFGQFSDFQGEGSFEQLGWHVHVLQPGQSNCLYHREEAQEDFMVLHGEALLLVEGQERPLKTWDVVHCPPQTEHVFVGAGSGPCAILMVGAKVPDRPLCYPVNETVLKHSAGVTEETPDPRVAYAGTAPSEPMKSPWRGVVG